MSFFPSLEVVLLEVAKYRFQEFINVVVLSFVQQKWPKSFVQGSDLTGFEKKFDTGFYIDAELTLIGLGGGGLI